MNVKAIAGLGLVMVVLAACSSIESPDGETNDRGATGGGGAAGGSGGTVGTGGNSAGGVNGGNSNGGSSGSINAGTGGSSSGGGAAGSPNAGMGGDGAGLGGMSTGGAGTAGAETGGAGTGGAPTGGAGTGGAGTGGGGGASTGPVTVQLDRTQQTIDGFGINNTYAPGMDDATADALFDPVNGLGLTILRIGMNPSGGHANTASPQDITKAKARGAQYIIGSTWSPPANCKDNNSTQNGGHLLTSCHESWSNTIANFARTNQLYAMSPGNEPDFASCGTAEPCNGVYDTTLYTASEMVAFMKVLGPKLRSAGVKMIGPEASEWLHVWSNESACCSEPGMKPSSDPLKGMGYDYGHAIHADATAWAALDILGVHQYDTQRAEPWPSDVAERKPIWQTEMSGVKWWPEQGPSSDINNGVAIAGWIHNALTVGQANAWLWWWWKAQGSTNEGLLLSNGTDTKRHYTFGNFTRFVRPGYVRVDIGGSIPTDVLLVAFKGSDGTVVVVAINKGSAAATVPISISGGTAPASLVPWVTSAQDNLVAKTAVTVSGGSFTAALASKTVTTFVGK